MCDLDLYIHFRVARSDVECEELEAWARKQAKRGVASRLTCSYGTSTARIVDEIGSNEKCKAIKLKRDRSAISPAEAEPVAQARLILLVMVNLAQLWILGYR